MPSIDQNDDLRSRESLALLGASSLPKCFTEILLNSYESYQRMIAKGEKAIPEIIIRANPTLESFEIIDHFEGLADTSEGANKILGTKSANQPTHTAESRAAMGRGMSDVLFRRSGSPAILAWRRNGKTFVFQSAYTQNQTRLKDLNDEQGEPELYDQFLVKEVESKIPEHGTLVQWFWKESEEETPYPTFEQVKKMLGHFFELKNMLNDENFSVILEYRKSDGSYEKHKIKFVQYPFEEVKSLGNTPLEIRIPDKLKRICKCGHPDSEHTGHCTANCACTQFTARTYDIRILSAQLWRSTERLNVAHDDMRTQGMYIEGEHKQMYTMEFFGLEDKYQVESPYYSGKVVLSKDAKQFMMDMYNFEKFAILTQTRTGFDKNLRNQLYHKLQRTLKPWIEDVLKSQSRISVDVKDISAKKGLSTLNSIMKKISETEDAFGNDGSGTTTSGTIGTGSGSGIGTNPGPPPPPPIPEFIQFQSQSYSITKDKLSTVRLLVNSKQFRAGTTIEWTKTDGNLQFDTSIPNTVNTNLDLLKIPLILISSVEGDLGSISATIKSKDGVERTASALISCHDVRNTVSFQPHNTIEFNPKTAKTKILTAKSIDLYTHGNVVKPDTKISIQFRPDTNNFSTLEPIEIKAPQTTDITAPEYSFTFNLPNSLPLQQSQNYRKTTITFEGTQPGLKGVIEAKTTIDGVPYTALCNFEFEAEQKGADGGKFKHWKAETLTSQDKTWVFEGGVAIANLALPHVSRMLGSNDEVAKKRYELYEETKFFVANGIAHLAFEEALVDDFGKHNAKLQQDGLTQMDRYKHLQSVKNEWDILHTDKIYAGFEIRPRTKIPVDKINEHHITIQYPYDMPQIELKSYDAGEYVIQNASFDNNSDLGNVRSRKDYVFKYHQEKITIGVYTFDNAIAVRLDSFDWNGEMQEVLLALRSKYHIYKKPEKTPEGIPEDWWQVPVEINEYESNKIVKIPITLDNIMKIPDPPRSDLGGIPYEDDKTWLINNERMIQYAIFDDVINHNKPSHRKGQLVSFIQKDETYFMAMNFLRHRILKPLQTYYFAKKTILSNTKTAKCETCGLEAMSNESVKNSFNLFLDNDDPQISKFCNQH